jgi:hypothetical protein
MEVKKGGGGEKKYGEGKDSYLNSPPLVRVRRKGFNLDTKFVMRAWKV